VGQELGIFVPIFNLNLRQVDKMREGFEISQKLSQVFEVDDILRGCKISRVGDKIKTERLDYRMVYRHDWCQLL
jgi:hypothetical protein